MLDELGFFRELHFLYLFEQIVGDLSHGFEWLFNLVRYAHVCLNYTKVVLDLFVHHVEGGHVLDEEHVAFIAIAIHLYSFDNNDLLSVLLVKVGFVQVNLEVLRKTVIFSVVHYFFKTVLFHWWCGLVISLTCLKWRKDETSEHCLFEFSSIILAWLFYECFQELEERVIKKFDFT